MKLIKEQFEIFALEQSYENGAELYDELGLNCNTYRHYKNEVPISAETLKKLCWEIGASKVSDFVRFEADERNRYRLILDGF